MVIDKRKTKGCTLLRKTGSNAWTLGTFLGQRKEMREETTEDEYSRNMQIHKEESELET